MDLVDDLTAAALGGSHKGLALEWFSVPGRAARLMLADHLELVSSLADAALPATRVDDAPAAPHLAVLGTSDLARAVVVNAARQWGADAARHERVADTERLRVTLASVGAKAWRERLLARYPSIAEAAELIAYEGDLRAPAEHEAAREALGDATAVFVCGSRRPESLGPGFAAARMTNRDNPVVVTLLIENAGFAKLLKTEEEVRVGAAVQHRRSNLFRGGDYERVLQQARTGASRGLPQSRGEERSGNIRRRCRMGRPRRKLPAVKPCSGSRRRREAPGNRLRDSPPHQMGGAGSRLHSGRGRVLGQA